MSENQASLTELWRQEVQTLLTDSQKKLIDENFGGIQGLLQFGAVYLEGKRLTQETLVLTGQYLRLHLNPKRYNHSWKHLAERIFFQNENYLVLNKPTRVPVHPTLDNYQENCLTQLQKILDQPLFLIHRLDVETSGLMIFAKNKPTQKYFSEMMNDRKLVKIYETLCQYPGPELGLKTHWMRNSERSPKILFTQETSDTKKCELIVSEKDFYDDNTVKLKIQLLTGRTHQIRAQLAFLGFPILGDDVYKLDSLQRSSLLQLSSTCLEFTEPRTLIRKKFEIPFVANNVT